MPLASGPQSATPAAPAHHTPSLGFPAFPFTTVPGPTHSCLAPSKPPQPPPCESPPGRELSIPPAALLSVVRPLSQSPLTLEPDRTLHDTACTLSPLLFRWVNSGHCPPLSQAASCRLVFPSTSRFAPSLEVVQSRAHSLAVLRILAPLFNHQANPGLHFVPYPYSYPPGPPKAPQKLHPSIRPPFDSLVRIQCKRGLGVLFRARACERFHHFVLTTDYPHFGRLGDSSSPQVFPRQSACTSTSNNTAHRFASVSTTAVICTSPARPSQTSLSVALISLRLIPRSATRPPPSESGRA
jgi:hypothetical protein